MKLDGKRLILLILLVGMIIWTIYNAKAFIATRNATQNKVGVSSIENQPPTPEGIRVIKGYNFGFSPNNITVKLGDVVNLKLVSDDSPHTITIDELGINKQFTYGKDAGVVFTATKKGTFQFYCAVEGHKENGMVGTITII